LECSESDSKCARRGWVLYRKDLANVEAWVSNFSDSSKCDHNHYLHPFICSVDDKLKNLFSAQLGNHYCHSFHFIRGALRPGGFGLHTAANDGEWTVVINLYNNGDQTVYKKIGNGTGFIANDPGGEAIINASVRLIEYENEFDLVLFRSSILHFTVMNVQNHENECPETVKLALFYVPNLRVTSTEYLKKNQLYWSKFDKARKHYLSLKSSIGNKHSLNT